MTLRIVPYYAALLGVLFALLSFAVIRFRRARQVSLGTGGSTELERRIRAHANFAEYCPFALLLLTMAELRGAGAALLHLLCLALVAGRIAHAWGVSRIDEDYRFRVAGVAGTMTAILGAALLIVLT